MAPTWTRDPIAALEDLVETDSSSQLPSRAPTLGKPTLRAHLGVIPETTLGLYGTTTRRRAEEDLIRLFFSQHQGHIAAASVLKPGTEASSQCQWEFLFQPTTEGVAARQDIRDAGGALLELPGHEAPIHLPCREAQDAYHPHLSGLWSATCQQTS